MTTPKVFIGLCTVLFLLGCATTRIVSTDPDADIYVDDQHVGRGTAEINSMGIPHTADVEARRGTEVLAQARMKRSITFTTALIGFSTMYTGFIWAWNYPDQFNLIVPYRRGDEAERENPWLVSPLKKKNSAWDQGTSKKKLEKKSVKTVENPPTPIQSVPETKEATSMGSEITPEPTRVDADSLAEPSKE